MHIFGGTHIQQLMCSLQFSQQPLLLASHYIYFSTQICLHTKMRRVYDYFFVAQLLSFPQFANLFLHSLNFSKQLPQFAVNLCFDFRTTLRVQSFCVNCQLFLEVLYGTLVLLTLLMQMGII